MNINSTLISLILLFLPSLSYGQDTIRLDRKPKVIIKSWYPEFKEFPDLKIGERKILYTKVPDFKVTSIRDNDINLITQDDSILIKETEKTNQYLITVNPTDSNNVEFEIWFEMTDKTILINQEGSWIDIRTLYPIKGNRILIDTVKLKIKK
ncbi:hypothetical protein KMW28_21670 [Flammeovirga yaeyamensis]|uniref:Uncharacterized protein n=1 Tax=Flammeovirga yaeyamensis TaxID=367791 RepID=A0AAX1NC45_9BACT|nr:hypothetical protein [Flammeovirga yaeyamensis]MBB3697036.1 hypothetical protein [Flammeovirga yaeyamensis]NMF33699.1 hypothetical protein [Flammeovirga yaeyamensis]QWG05035.1 hypothetical protein KMW28_21670 [Flammeovirga yaeyamensis]